MIEIKLIGDDALAYIRNEKITDSILEKLQQDYEKLYSKYTDLQTRSKPTEPSCKPSFSSRVLTDSEKVKDFQKPNVIAKKITKRDKWSTIEIGIIKYAASRPEGETNRRLSSMLGKLSGRTKEALATKVNAMGYSCKKGYMVGS